jgi:hypothetical protein
MAMKVIFRQMMGGVWIEGNVSMKPAHEMGGADSWSAPSQSTDYLKFPVWLWPCHQIAIHFLQAVPHSVDASNL